MHTFPPLRPSIIASVSHMQHLPTQQDAVTPVLRDGDCLSHINVAELGLVEFDLSESHSLVDSFAYFHNIKSLCALCESIQMRSGKRLLVLVYPADQS